MFSCIRIFTIILCSSITEYFIIGDSYLNTDLWQQIELSLIQLRHTMVFKQLVSNHIKLTIQRRFAKVTFAKTDYPYDIILIFKCELFPICVLPSVISYL